MAKTRMIELIGGPCSGWRMRNAPSPGAMIEAKTADEVVTGVHGYVVNSDGKTARYIRSSRTSSMGVVFVVTGCTWVDHESSHAFWTVAAYTDKDKAEKHAKDALTEATRLEALLRKKQDKYNLLEGEELEKAGDYPNKLGRNKFDPLFNKMHGGGDNINYTVERTVFNG